MEESKRQKQIGKLIQEELSNIFQREGINVIKGGMVSLSKVTVTPDLLEARVYLSFYRIEDKKGLLNEIRQQTAHLRGLLGNKLRFQLRRIPTLAFVEDDTLEHVFHMEEIFKQIHKEEQERNGDKEN